MTMAYDFTSQDGLAHSNDSSFIDSWNKIAQQRKQDNERWLHQMRALGATIVTPDDGNVDRKLHKVAPPDYALLHLVTREGSLIALGSLHEWRLVRCIKVERTWVTNNPLYCFDPQPIKSFPEE